MYTRRAFLSAAIPLAGASSRDERLRADLQFLIASIESTHPSPWTLVPRSEFLRAADEFSASLPSLGEHAVVPGFARLLARIGDAHTRIAPDSGAAYIPLRLRWYSDGLFVAGTADRVHAIGGLGVEAAFLRVLPFSPTRTSAGHA